MTSDTTKWFLDHMNPAKIWDNVRCIISSGADIDYLLGLGEPYYGYFAEHSEQILDLLADPQTLLKANEEWYLTNINCSKEMEGILKKYVEHGLSKNYAEEWLKTHYYY